MTDAVRSAERSARASYGRPLAHVAARTRDIAEAEDALSEAFVKALATWPRDGVPRNPDAWLLTVARNRLTDRQRHLARFPATNDIPDGAGSAGDGASFPDQRLLLMMVCAHPAIAPDLHAPLMLQTVLGLEAREIAQLFQISPAALAKSLVRAKARIKQARIPFALPEADQLPARSDAVLEAIYAIHAHDWLAPTERFGGEALYLADLVARLLPTDAEALGLAALIAFSHARAGARIAEQALVPVAEQDTKLWDAGLIAYGNALLTRAHALGEVGRYQLAAAIDAVHMARATTGRTDWDALLRLYHALVATSPSIGALVAQCVVIGSAQGVDAGLAALGRLDGAATAAFQPFYAARADMLARAGRSGAAAADYERAIALATDTPTIRFLKSRRASVLKP